MNRTGRFLIHAGLGLMPFLLVLALWPWVRPVLDATGSLGGGLFVVIVGDTSLSTGELVAFHPPANRFFADDETFIKVVGGVSGDVIRREGRSLYNGSQALGTAKPFSRQGEPLQPFDGGRVPEGAYYVYSEHVDAFDSRYVDIGFVGKEQIIGKAYRIF